MKIKFQILLIRRKIGNEEKEIVTRNHRPEKLPKRMYLAEVPRKQKRRDEIIIKLVKNLE